jgi:hypothetical protein
MKKILFLLALTFIVIEGAYSQQIINCAQTLRLARSTYDQGRLHELPELLKRCLTDGFTQSEKVQAYTFLTLAYIYLEEPEEADKSMLELLRTDPYFIPNPDVDPAEFIGLYKTFRTRPVYRLGVKFNVNATQPNVSDYNPVSNGTGKYTYKVGFGGGIVAEVPLNDDLTLNGELHYTSKSFSNTFQSMNPGETTPHATTTGLEKLNWISLPILAQYRITENRLNPFVTGGFSVDYLLSSSITGDEKRSKAQSIESQTFDVFPQRQKINVSLLVGAGIKFRIAGGYAVGEVKYGYGLSRVNSASTLLANQSLLFNYGYVDGIYRLSAVSVSVGYVQNFFNPKKLKRK